MKTVILRKIAYFSMEFAIHQPLKIYSGGLGFSFWLPFRSAYELRQNMIGIGIFGSMVIMTRPAIRIKPYR